jgi:hypothetical protein
MEPLMLTDEAPMLMDPLIGAGGCCWPAGEGASDGEVAAVTAAVGCC